GGVATSQRLPQTPGLSLPAGDSGGVVAPPVVGRTGDGGIARGLRRVRVGPSRSLDPKRRGGRHWPADRPVRAATSLGVLARVAGPDMAGLAAGQLLPWPADLRRGVF